MKEIVFHSLAKSELLAARDYYDELVYGLGETFISEFEKCLRIISVNPLGYPVIQEKIRKAVIIKFPFSILYRSEKERIFILAVMHQKRKPHYWIERST